MNANYPKPPNHLIWAILVTLFCCLPLGIVSIVFAAKVDGLAAAGDIVGAQEASDKAKLWAMIGAGSGLVVAVLYFLFVGMAVMSGELR